jgi:transcriptional regulator with XRE-family HTH domain
MKQHSFGYWLRLKRKALDLTQQKLADQVGYSAAAIRKLEAEERRPSTQFVERLAELFDIPASERCAFLRFARGDWQTAPDETLDAVPWRAATSLPAANGRNSASAVASQVAVSWPDHTARGRFVGREWETAVIGHEFEFDLLRQAANLDEDGLIEALEQAERAQLIHEVDAGRDGAFSFTRGLIPVVLVAGWSGLRRRRQRRHLVSLIEERRGDDYKAPAHRYAAAADGKRPYIPE